MEAQERAAERWLLPVRPTSGRCCSVCSICIEALAILLQNLAGYERLCSQSLCSAQCEDEQSCCVRSPSCSEGVQHGVRSVQHLAHQLVPDVGLPLLFVVPATILLPAAPLTPAAVAATVTTAIAAAPPQ